MRHSRPSLSLVPLLVGIALLAGTLSSRAPVDAAVVHHQGFNGTVAGWRSWYGSYGMGSLGTGWCIDHGLRAPDALYGYVATDLAGTPEEIRTAMAWVLGRNTPADRVDSAAMMLVLHDLMGAVYPTGRLDVDRLRPQDMRGFEGYESAVIERARAFKRDGLAHRHLRGPLSVALVAPPVAPGAPVVVEVRVRDRNGAAVEGAWVQTKTTTSAEGAKPPLRTGPDGKARFSFRAVEGTNRFEATVRVPAIKPSAWAPTTARAQRIAVREEQHLRAADGFVAERPTGELIVRKTGDAEPVLPVAGAAFDVTDSSGKVVGRFNVGANGYSGALRLPVGKYKVTEVRRPAGYGLAPPQTIQVMEKRRTTVEVSDKAVRSRITLLKLSSMNSSPLAGAVFEIRHDRDGDGKFESKVGTVTTGADGTAVLENVMPGSYQAVELQAPEHHDLLTAPVPFVVPIDGAPVTVKLVNTPRAGVRFVKIPVGDAPPESSLAGATFVVAPAQGSQSDQTGETGRCTTDDTGSCSLPVGALRAGAEYCWAEEAAPIGWALAEPGCFTAGIPGSVIEIEVMERSRYTHLTARKTDVSDGSPLGGAVYDLFRIDLAQVMRTTPADVPPAPEGASWVGRATSGTDGIMRWPLVEPDGLYCIVEHTAPNGYLASGQAACSDRRHTPEHPLHFEVTDEPVPVETPSTTTTTQPVPDTTTPEITTPETTTPPTTAPEATVTTTSVPVTEAPATTGTAPPSSTVTTVRNPPETTVPQMASHHTSSVHAALPVTGSRTKPLTALGATMVLAGLGLQVPTRRRR